MMMLYQFYELFVCNMIKRIKNDFPAASACQHCTIIGHPPILQKYHITYEIPIPV